MAHKGDPAAVAWLREWQDIEAQVERGAPDPGEFEAWRKEHFNIVKENPFTGRKKNIGVTFPYMRPFIQALQDPKVLKVLELLPIRHAKSELAEQFIVWLLCKWPQARVLIICANDRQAKKRLGKIKRVLEDRHTFKSLHEKWGPWVGKGDHTWGKTAISVKGQKGADRDFSVQCVGIGGQIYGDRADLILLDDIDQPGLGQDKRDSILDTLDEVIVGRLDEGGKLVYIGTRCGATDIPSVLMGRPGWWVDIQKCGPNGEPLEPEMYSQEEINVFRESISERAYSLTFMNEPYSEDDALFTPALVDSSKGNFADAPEDWKRIVSLDPATSGRAALVVVAYHEESRQARIVDVDARLNPRHDGLFDMLQKAVLKHRPQTVVIEAQGGSHLFSEVPQVRTFIYDEVHSQRPLVEFQTGSNKHDPNFGVPLVAELMAKERLRIAWAADQPAVVMRMKPLIDDLLAYRPVMGGKKRYDTVLALWFACKTIQDGIKQAGSRRAWQGQAILRRHGWLRKDHLRRVV